MKKIRKPRESIQELSNNLDFLEQGLWNLKKKKNWKLEIKIDNTEKILNRFNQALGNRKKKLKRRNKAPDT
jgi:hypothetical protein